MYSTWATWANRSDASRWLTPCWFHPRRAPFLELSQTTKIGGGFKQIGERRDIDALYNPGRQSVEIILFDLKLRDRNKRHSLIVLFGCFWCRAQLCWGSYMYTNLRMTLKFISIRSEHGCTQASLDRQQPSIECSPLWWHAHTMEDEGRRRITAPKEQNDWQLLSLCRYQWSFTFQDWRREEIFRVLFSSSLFLIYERVISLRMFVNSFVFFLFVCKELCWSDPDATRQRIHCPKQNTQEKGCVYTLLQPST